MKTRKKWIRENTWNFIEKRKAQHKELITVRALTDKKEQHWVNQNLNKRVKRAVRSDKKVWTEYLALRAQSTNKNMRELYQITKHLSAKTSLQTPTVILPLKQRTS
ncbi:hypothetical protein HHI36_000383 [Cryptolaemus montrouzieri]|uniref:Uncharacterized protein n=1 Tax=Cryptolaemus montrouzieri TaxID=559131 RepID=A0ABD2P4G2_9CUCU